MENKEIELRSEEVQEVMGQIPSWILRNGTSVLLAIVLALLVVSYFFKYPDTIQTRMTLTGSHPAAQLIARNNGKLQHLFIKDGENVLKDQYLAVIENPAVAEDVFNLKQSLQSIMDMPDSAVQVFLPAKDLSLGDIQIVYTTFLRSLQEYSNYRHLNYYPQKKEVLAKQIEKYLTYLENLKRQHMVVQEQYEIAHDRYFRDSTLYVRSVTSLFEYENARTKFLQSKHSLESSSASIYNTSIQITSMEGNLLDLESAQTEKENLLLHEFRTTMEQLLNSINSWELNYAIKSPTNGTVTFTKFWSINQNVSSGEVVCTVIPDRKDDILGKALLPLRNSGKVKTGQRVIVRFSNFPDQEFGIVNGAVSSISLVPSDGNYIIEIAFPNGLTTNYKKTLPVSPEMQASAEIITDDLRLIERLFMPLKKILKEGFGN